MRELERWCLGLKPEPREKKPSFGSQVLYFLFLAYASYWLLKALFYSAELAKISDELLRQ